MKNIKKSKGSKRTTHLKVVKPSTGVPSKQLQQPFKPEDEEKEIINEINKYLPVFITAAGMVKTEFKKQTSKEKFKETLSIIEGMRNVSESRTANVLNLTASGILLRKEGLEKIISEGNITGIDLMELEFINSVFEFKTDEKTAE